MQKKIKKILAAILSISIAFSGNGICVRAKQKLPKPVITKVYSGGKGQITVVYKKIASAKKYQVQISKDKKFKKGIKTKQAAKVKKSYLKGLQKEHTMCICAVSTRLVKKISMVILVK